MVCQIKPRIDGNSLGNNKAIMEKTINELTRYSEPIKPPKEVSSILTHNQIMNAVGTENINEANNPSRLALRNPSSDFLFMKFPQ